MSLRGDRILWKLDSRRLRILCYHGVCADNVAGEPWVPHFFVKQSSFEKHLHYLRHNATLLPLDEAIQRLQDGTLPPRSVSITFDDGYANNLTAAYPLLRSYDAPATIFLASGYMESGELFPFLKLRLARLHAAASGTDADAGEELDYKSEPLDRIVHAADRWFGRAGIRLNRDQWDALRPLTVAEIRAADSRLIDFGAHSHTHCILRNETPARREHEIRTSLQKIRDWLGRPVKFFSYPNGQRGDFNESDKVALRSENVQAAVSGIAGANAAGADLLELRRYPVGMFHDELAFPMEVTGARSALLSVAGRVA